MKNISLGYQATGDALLGARWIWKLDPPLLVLLAEKHAPHKRADGGAGLRGLQLALAHLNWPLNPLREKM